MSLVSSSKVPDPQCTLLHYDFRCLWVSHLATTVACVQFAAKRFNSCVVQSKPAASVACNIELPARVACVASFPDFGASVVVWNYVGIEIFEEKVAKRLFAESLTFLPRCLQYIFC